MSDAGWYYCIEHHAVEPFGACPSKDRLGPYETEQEAAHALQIAEDRNEEWDNDPAWNDDEEDDD